MSTVSVGKQRGFVIKSFGCKTNRADSDKIASSLVAQGWRKTEESPVLYIVNACCVTARSENNALRAARAFKEAHPVSEVVLSGCVTDSLKEAAAAAGILLRKYPLLVTAVAPEGRQRYFLKIQNGCDNFCSYCVVPFVRGRSVSVSRENIMRELADLERGSNFPSEIVLTGTNISNYCHSGDSLLGIIRAIRKKYSSRIRLGSLEPPLSRDFIKGLSEFPGICPHFPVPLQSGSDRLLRKMRRNYSVSDFVKILEDIRKYFDKPAVTTDIIYGFPGESEDDFNKTLNFIKQAGFSKTHIFPFSPRPGTLTALEKVLPASVLRDRKGHLEAAADTAAEIYRRQFIGRDLEVVAETKRDGRFYGTSANYLKVRFSAPQTLPGDIVRVAVEAASSGVMNGSARETLWTASR